MSAALTSLILIMGFIVVYILLIQVYSVLFRLTGLTKDKANFQAISLLTSVGFTTKESELITSNRTRKRIASAAMITGYTFSVIIVSLIINLMLRINTSQIKSSLSVVAIAFAAFILLLIIIRIPFIRKGIEKLIEKLAGKLMRSAKNSNVITLLDNYGKRAICEVYINHLPAAFVDKSLAEAKIKENYDLNILMLKRKEKFIDVTKDTMIQNKDVVVVYGLYQKIKDAFEHYGEVSEVSEAKIENRLELIDNYDDDAMMEIEVSIVPELLKNVPLSLSGLKTQHNINVLMIKRDNKPVSVTPAAQIEQNDSIIVFGPYKNIKSIFELSE